MILKRILRSILIFFHIDLTKNLKYDRLTKKVMERVLNHSSNCVDVGCHQGEILDIILKLSPKGKHFSFEPIPFFYKSLKQKYNNVATIYPYALSDHSGKSKFQVVKNALAYSGIKKRRYDIDKPEIKEIEVELRRLDDILPTDVNIDFIKIDVEGGEFDVLKGAKQIISKYKPIIVLESGLGASDFYGTKPDVLYTFIEEDIKLNISLLDSFLKGRQALTKEEFINIFNQNKEYYFVLHP